MISGSDETDNLTCGNYRFTTGCQVYEYGYFISFEDSPSSNKQKNTWMLGNSRNKSVIFAPSCIIL